MYKLGPDNCFMVYIDGKWIKTFNPTVERLTYELVLLQKRLEHLEGDHK